MCLAVLGQVDADVPAILARAIEESPKLTYSGERTVQYRRGGELVRLREIVLRNGDRLRIEFPGNSEFRGQIIVETPSERRHYLPDKNEIRVMAPRNEENLERLRRLMKRMKGELRFSVKPGIKIAGRNTEAVQIQDKSGNVLQRLYIDPSTGALLKRQVYDGVGGVLAEFQFSRINYSPRVAPDAFTIQRRGARIRLPQDDLRELAQAKGFPAAMIDGVPGVKLEWARAWDRTPNAIMQSYRTGSGRLTFFMLPQDVNRPMPDGRHGLVQSEKWTVDGKTYVLIGPRDFQEFDRCARRLKQQTQGGS